MNFKINRELLLPALQKTTSVVEKKNTMPILGNVLLSIEGDTLKNAINRVAILSNEKFHGVEIDVTGKLLTIKTNNPEHEEADESLDIDYIGNDFSLAFNAEYMIDALAHVKSDNVILSVASNQSCVLIKDTDTSEFVFVIMPMRM